MKPIKIEDHLFDFKTDELIIDGENVTANIVDAEIDPIQCTFNNDSCVQLNTADLTYIILTKENLMTLIDLIEQSEDYFETYDFDDTSL